MKSPNKKLILDATCGGRMMWFNKEHPNALYVDRREVPRGTIEIRKNFHVSPDIVADFTDLPFDDGAFKLVVFDPPHIHRENNSTPTSFMGLKFGVLGADWQETIAAGFSECWRVLATEGVLIFKWSEEKISSKEVLALFNEDPLFGHTTTRKGTTKWFTFMKLED